MSSDWSDLKGHSFVCFPILNFAQSQLYPAVWQLIFQATPIHPMNPGKFRLKISGKWLHT